MIRFISRGLNVNSKNKQWADVNTKDKAGGTALLATLHIDNTQIVELLNRYGAKE
jgi:ankyrin repeat protein